MIRRALSLGSSAAFVLACFATACSGSSGSPSGGNDGAASDDSGTDASPSDASVEDASVGDGSHEDGTAPQGRTEAGVNEAGTDGAAIGEAGGSEGGAGEAGGADSGSTPDADTITGPEYTVSGTLAGLTVGESIVLQDIAGNPFTLSQNGPFTLHTALVDGGRYGVSIKTNPSSPIVQTCVLTNGTGSINDAGVVAATGGDGGDAGDAGDAGESDAGSESDAAETPTGLTITCDMLAYFPFTGNANDESGYGHNGAVTNGILTADRNGVANSAYVFAGTGYIVASMPDGFLPTGDTSRTLTAWLEQTEATNENAVVYWGNGNCNDLQYGFGVQDGDEAYFWAGCDDYESPTLTVPLATAQTPAWTFVALTYSQSAPTTINVYVNSGVDHGTLLGNLMTPSVMNDLVMGADLIDSAYFIGKLDSVRVYGHALSAAEIQSIYTSSAP
jgi:hypothetical protein